MTQNIDRYEIIEEIGHGGFAKVYKARDTVLDRLVAMKIMHPALMSDAGFVARFQREAKIIASLQHPYIIPIHDYGESEGRLFIVMKLMESSLFSQIQQGPISWEQTKKIVNQISSALDFAHNKDVIHRDIKPENILLDENLNAVIADFGLVKALEKSSLSISLSSNNILGTPAYLPPEVWNGEDVTLATDIYALACVVYEMVTGEKLFQGPTPPATMTLHFRPPQFPDTWPVGMPAGIAPFLEKALDRNPLQRFESAGKFAEALDSLLEDPLAEKYTTLVTTLTDRYWVEAISLAEVILEKDTKYKDVQNLLHEAIKEKAEDNKLLLISQWREQAEEAMIQEEWSSAIAAAQQWKQLASDDPDANAIIVSAKEKQKCLQQEQTHEKKRIAVPIWVWLVAGTVVIALLFFGGSQLFDGDDNSGTAERTTNSTAAIALVTDTLTPAATTNTPPPQPINTSKSTSTKTPTSRPTNTPKPTAINTPTSRPTNTPKPTAINTPTPRPTNTPKPTTTNILSPVPTMTATAPPSIIVSEPLTISPEESASIGSHYYSPFSDDPGHCGDFSGGTITFDFVSSDRMVIDNPNWTDRFNREWPRFASNEWQIEIPIQGTSLGSIETITFRSDGFDLKSQNTNPEFPLDWVCYYHFFRA